MEKELTFVRNVYFDTSILIRIPLGAPHVDFLKLKDSCRVLETKLLIPELVLKEYINHHQEEVRTSLSNINIINDRIATKIQYPNDQSALLKETESLMRKKIEELGITVFKSDISQEKLIELALKIPYKERNKKMGLKDSLILMSIIEYANSDTKGLNIFIADDKFFHVDAAESIIEFCKADIKIVKSLPEAAEIVDVTLRNIGRALTLERENTLKTFLESQNSRIIEFVKRGRFNSFRLSLGDPGESSLGGTIEKIKAIEYESIHSARPPRELVVSEAKRVKISFMVRVKFIVTVRSFSYPSGDLLQLDQFEEDTTNIDQYLISGTTSATYVDNIDDAIVPYASILGHLGQKSSEQPILRNISVEATSLLKWTEEGDEYSDLQFERIII